MFEEQPGRYQSTRSWNNYTASIAALASRRVPLTVSSDVYLHGSRDLTLREIEKNSIGFSHYDSFSLGEEDHVMFGETIEHNFNRDNKKSFRIGPSLVLITLDFLKVLSLNLDDGYGIFSVFHIQQGFRLCRFHPPPRVIGEERQLKGS